MRIKNRFARLALAWAVCALAPLAVAQDGDPERYGPPIPPKRGGVPEIVIEEPEFSWGKALQGDMITHAFVIKNTGEGLLRITQVKPGCGCTSKRFDREIAPGSTGEVVLTLDTTKLRGERVRKYATIYTNDPANAQVKVYMEGGVTQIVVTEPMTVNMSGLAGDPLSGELILKRGADLDFTVERVVAKNNHLEVLDQATVTPGQEYRVTLGAKPADRPQVMRDNLVVTVRTSDGETRDLNVSAVLEHRDRITIQPRGNVVFQRRQTERLLTHPDVRVVRDIQVFGGREDIQFNLTNVELVDLDPEIFEVTWAALQPGHRYKISVRVKKYDETQRMARGRLRIHTDDPENPTRELAVYAQFGNTPARRATPPRTKERSGNTNQNVPKKKEAAGNANG